MIARVVVTILATLAVTAAATGLGRLVKGSLPASIQKTERLALSVLFGGGLLGLSLFLIGQVVFTRGIIGLIVAVGAAINLPALFRSVRAGRNRTGWASSGEILVVPIVVLAMLLVSSLAQPVGDFGNDAISYHLLGPVEWLQTHRVAPILDSAFTAFPATIEMLYTGVVALSGDRAAAPLGVVFALILLAQTWGLAKSLGCDDLCAGIAVALVSAMPIVMSTASVCFVDVPFAAFTLAAVRLGLEAATARAFVVAGAYSGFALGSKYTAIPILIITVIILFARFAKDLPYRQRLKDHAAFVASAILVGSPWYLKNFLQLGSPLYPPPPLLAGLFPAKALSLETSRGIQNYILERGQGLGRGPLDLLLLPIRLTFAPERFHGAGGLGIGPLAIGTLGVIRSIGDSKAKSWIVWSVAVALCWFFTQQEARFLINVLVVGGVFAGLGCGPLLKQASIIGRLVTLTALGLSLCYGIGYLTKERIDPVRSLISPAYAEARWQREVPFASSFAFLNRTREVQRVLILHPFVLPYYLDRSYIKIRGQYGERPIEGIGSFSDIQGRLAEFGITHILDVNYFDSDFEVSPADQLKLVFSEPNARIYEVAAR